MRIAFYGSSLLSAYWNGAATYYRGLLEALAGYGHDIVFFEPDAFDRQAHRDIDCPDWARVVVWQATNAGMRAAAAQAAAADVVVKASGVGVFDDALLDAVLEAARPGAVRIFWDVDAPATLAAMRADPAAPLRRRLADLDLVLTYGGGPPVIAAYRELGAAECIPVYNALDAKTHFPATGEHRYAADLAFLGNRLPDREARVEAFFLRAAALLVDRSFLLGGSGWDDKDVPPNVRRIGHVPTGQHNALNSSALAVLNIARDSMAATGFSPATRVFEAAGAGACLITDAWEGIELFFRPERGNPGGARWRGGGRASARSHADARAPDRQRGTPAVSGGAQLRAAGRAGACAVDDGCHAQTRECRGMSHAQAREHRGMSRERRLRIVVLGLSLSSSWGNGHATTYRALLKGLAARGHQVLFLERDKPWYAEHRDLPKPGFCRFALYQDVDALHAWERDIREADLVVLGSYVPDGIAASGARMGAAAGAAAGVPTTSTRR